MTNVIPSLPFISGEHPPVDLATHPSPTHGGQLRQASACFGIPLADWLDLSTGINPCAWPVIAPPASAWVRLPEEDDGLDAAAAAFYGTPFHPLPVAGSQAAIQALPNLRAPCRVGVPQVGYQEHAHAWHRAGHQVITLPDSDPGRALDEIDCLIVINPNNPTGHCWPLATLRDWHHQLAARNGWLIVDEAFMDATPEQSMAADAGRTGLILLRSLGKFFGLAGARVGFLFAEPALQSRLKSLLGPWTLNGPARCIARQALRDTGWQQTTRATLPRDGERLASLLHRHGLTPVGGTALFQWVITPEADRLYRALAQQGILVRHFIAPRSLRLGLPGSASDWERLDMALAAVVQS